MILIALIGIRRKLIKGGMVKGSFLAALLLLGTGLLFSGCGGLSDDAAAEVNGTVITKEDVDARIEYRNSLYPGMVSREDEVNFPKILRQTTKELVSIELQAQEAERRGIEVTDAEVEAELQRLADDDYLGDLPKMLEIFAERNVTKETLSRVTWERLLNEKLIADIRNDISVSEYDIQTYYESNVNLFNQPEMRQTRHLVAATKAEALEAANRIRAGESFVELAKQMSLDPMAAEKGGSLGLVAPGQLSPELDAVIFTMSLGQISDPVNVGDKWYIVTVEAIQPGGEKMSDEAVRAEIEGTLAEEIFAAQYKSLIDGLYDEASLEYDPDYEPQ